MFAYHQLYHKVTQKGINQDNERLLLLPQSRPLKPCRVKSVKPGLGKVACLAHHQLTFLLAQADHTGLQQEH